MVSIDIEYIHKLEQDYIKKIHDLTKELDNLKKINKKNIKKIKELQEIVELEFGY